MAVHWERGRVPKSVIDPVQSLPGDQKRLNRAHSHTARTSSLQVGCHQPLRKSGKSSRTFAGGGAAGSAMAEG